MSGYREFGVRLSAEERAQKRSDWLEGRPSLNRYGLLEVPSLQKRRSGCETTVDVMSS